MELVFSNVKPLKFIQDPILISGSRSINLSGVEYILAKEGDAITDIFEIRFKSHIGTISQAFMVDQILAVGHEDYFYLYDLTHQLNLVAMEMDEYFCHLYINDSLFYVSSAGSIYCFDLKGKEIWRNSNLGIDGVFIERFTHDKIYGSGESDPPGGWRDFVLDIVNGVSFVE